MEGQAGGDLALPPNWMMQMTPDGRLYYVHTIDGISHATWQHPLELHQHNIISSQEKDVNAHMDDTQLNDFGLGNLNHLVPVQSEFDRLFDDLITHDDTPKHAQEVLGHLRRHSSLKVFTPLTPDVAPEFNLEDLHSDLMSIDMPVSMRTSMSNLLKRGSFADILEMVKNECQDSQPNGLHPTQRDSFGNLISLINCPEQAQMVAGMPKHIARRNQLDDLDTAAMEEDFVAQIAGAKPI